MPGFDDPDGPLVTVVVLAWECREQLRRCLASLLEQDHPALEVVVVDNGSTDDPRPIFDAVAAGRSAWSWIDLGTNTGFAVGMNAGIAVARGEVVVPLNCDAVLSPTFVSRAVGVLRDRPDVGAVAPLVVRVGPDEDTTVLERYADRPLDGAAIRIRRRMRVVVEGDPGTARYCAKPNGSCPVYRRAALADADATFGPGPFDATYITFGEDTDLTLRLWSLGWTTWFEPTVVAGHVRSFGSSLGLRHKAPHLQVNLLSARHRNACRHLGTLWLVPIAAVLLGEDLGYAAVQLMRGDRGGARNVRAAYRRLWTEREDLLRFRRHRTWRHIPRSVYRPSTRRRTARSRSGSLHQGFLLLSRKTRKA